MQHQTVPETTGVIATIRALLAAGWRNDSVHQMANGDTVRTMIHPSGREITASTGVYDVDTKLTLTGLDLDQVAGAINGAGFAPVEQPVTTDPRQVAWQIVINGVAGGLPIPAATEIPGHYNMFIVRLPQNDMAGVDAWVSHLGLREPKLAAPLSGEKVADYSSVTYSFPRLPGWTVYVRCFVETDGGVR